MLLKLFLCTVASMHGGNNFSPFTQTSSLAVPELWTDIHITPRHVFLARAFFQYSKDRLVDVAISTSSEKDFSAVEVRQIRDLLAKHGERVRHCSIKVESDIFGTDGSAQLDPPKFKDGETPGYRILLDSLSLLFPPHLPALTHLELETCDSVLLEGLVPLLGRCPHLQVLSLWQLHPTLPRMDTESLKWMWPVILPSLQKLSVVDYGIFFTDYLLCSLVFPGSATIHMEFRGRCPQKLSEALSLDSVMSRITTANLHFAKKIIHPDTPEDRVVQEAMLHLYSSSCTFSAQWRWEIGEGELTDLSHVGHTIFKLPSLKNLSVHLEDVDITASMWEQILGQIPLNNDLSLTVHFRLHGDVNFVVVPGAGVRHPLPVNGDEHLLPINGDEHALPANVVQLPLPLSGGLLPSSVNYPEESWCRRAANTIRRALSRLCTRCTALSQVFLTLAPRAFIRWPSPCFQTVRAL